MCVFLKFYGILYQLVSEIPLTTIVVDFSVDAGQSVVLSY